MRQAVSQEQSLIPAKPFTVSDELLELQRRAVELILSKKTVGIFAEQRTGKTIISISALSALWKPGFKALVICMLTNKKTTWHQLLTKLMPQLPLYDKLEDFYGKGGLLLIHYQQLDSLIKKLKKVSWDLIIADESQAIKARGSLASRRMRQLRDCAEYKVILSGTPIEQQPQDTWAQFRFMRPDIFGDKWATFEQEYLKPSGYMGYKLKFRPEKLPSFLERIAPWTMRIDRAQGGIVNPVLVDYPVEFGARARRLYDEFDLTSTVMVDGVKVHAPLKITRNGKLHQMCGGILIDDAGETHTISSAKALACANLVRRLGVPVVVFARYLDEMTRIASALRQYRVELLWGGVKDTRGKDHRSSLQRRFANGEIDVLICQIRTGGVGTDFSHAKFAIIYSTTYSFIDLDQALSRLCHPTRQDPPEVYMLRVVDTVDDDLVKAYKKKSRVVESVMSRIRVDSPNIKS